jgi:hypothetical protein
MSLTRHDFQVITQALLAKDPRRGCYCSEDMLDQWKVDCNAVSYALSTLNPNFDRQRFLAACQATTEPQS